MFDHLADKLNAAVNVVKGKKQLSEKNISDALREVRRALLEADVALEVIKAFISRVEQKSIGMEVSAGLSPSQMFIKLVEQQLTEVIGGANETLNLKTQPPAVVMVAGLQGSGKTTSLAKLARFLKEREKKKVLLVSADVYRPAAIEQLKRLAEQTQIDFFSSDSSQKPEKIVKNAKDYAAKHYFDVLLVDTAGRLHIDDEMMAEIQTLQQIINPIETLFVIDAMVGQDALNSAKAFGEALPLTGIIVTKVDADTRGGAALSARYVTGKPIKFLGVGEKTEALEPFHPERIVSRLLGMGDVLSLVEEIERKVDRKQAEKSAKKIAKGRFDLEDMRDQLEQMQTMGGMDKMLDKLPGVGNIPEHLKKKALGDDKAPQMIAIINSMTKKERMFPNLVAKSSRKKRIANGSGTNIQAVNQLMKQFEKMQRMMKKMKGGKMQKMMQQFSQSGGDMGEMMNPKNMPKFPFR